MSHAIVLECRSLTDVGEPTQLAKKAKDGNHVVLRFNRLSEQEKAGLIARLSHALPDYSIFDSSVSTSPMTITIMPVVAAARVLERKESVFTAIEDYHRMCSEFVRHFQAGTLPSEWDAREHGGHLRFYNHKTGQVVEAPFRELVNPNRVDPFFFAKFVKSTLGLKAVGEMIEHDFHDAARILEIIAVEKVRHLVSFVQAKVMVAREAAMQFMALLGAQPGSIYLMYPILSPHIDARLRDIAKMPDQEWYCNWFGSACGPCRIEAVEISDNEPKVTVRKRHLDTDRVESYPVYANHPARVAIETLRRYLAARTSDHDARIVAAQQLLAAFIAFAGPSRFRRFVLQLRLDAPQNWKFRSRHVPGGRRVRLRYWQADLWHEFRDEYPDAPDDIGLIRAALLWCDLHGRYLADSRGFEASGVYELPGFTDALDSSFPFGYGYWSLVCPDCVAACRAWVEAHVPNVKSDAE